MSMIWRRINSSVNFCTSCDCRSRSIVFSDTLSSSAIVAMVLPWAFSSITLRLRAVLRSLFFVFGTFWVCVGCVFSKFITFVLFCGAGGLFF